jgi:hypothetical protein
MGEFPFGRIPVWAKLKGVRQETARPWFPISEPTAVAPANNCGFADLRMLPPDLIKFAAG